MDHIRPLSRGGRSIVENGVCASHTFNGKKRANAADTAFLFEKGLPTWRYYDIYGSLTSVADKRLRRLAELEVADWYLNRAIGQYLIGFDYRCWRDTRGDDPVRTDRYCFRAAFKKLAKYRTLQEGPSLESRGIVKKPSPTARQWLSLRCLGSEKDALVVIASLFPIYRANFKAWCRYFYDSATGSEKRRALAAAEKSRKLTGDTLACIQSDFALRHD